MNPHRFLERSIDAAVHHAQKKLGAWIATAVADSWLTNGTLRVLPQLSDDPDDEEFVIPRLRGFPIVAGDHVLVLTLDGKDFALGAFGGDDGGLANGIKVFTDTNTGATVGTNASTSVYQEHATWNVTLPPGTWECYAQAKGNYSNNTANSGASNRINGFATGSSAGQNSIPANAPFSVEAEASASGISGTCSIVLEYTARTGGTATAGHSSVLLIALRTAMT